jgi:hypothetical protein
MARVSTGFGNSPIKAKFQDAERLRVHPLLVIGGRDMDAGAVSVRLHGKGPQRAKLKLKWWRTFWWRPKSGERSGAPADRLSPNQQIGNLLRSLPPSAFALPAAFDIKGDEE